MYEHKEVNLSKFSKIAGVATLVAVMGVVVLGVAVYAQEPTPPNPIGWMADYFEQIRNAIASKLGVERADLDTAMQEARQEVIQQAVTDEQLTQEQADRMLSRREEGFGPGMMGFGRGKKGCFGNRMGGWVGSENHDVLAEQLGMTADELQAELEAGKTIAELAEEKGVDLQANRVEAMKEQIQQAVEDGRMTQEQADWMLDGLEQGFAPMKRGFGHARGGHFGLWGHTTP